MSDPQTQENPSVVSFAKPFEQRRLSHHMDLLNTLMADDSISDIMINRYDRIFIDRRGDISELDMHFDSHEGVLGVAMELIRQAGKEKLAEENSVIDGVLPDGNRLAVILPPIAVEGATISIRKFPKSPFTLQGLIDKHYLPVDLAEFLREAMLARVNVIISGNTSSGKTTLLNALTASIGDGERIVSVEDTPELQIQQRNVVRLVTQGVANRKRDGDMSVRDLVRCALRVRPDRILLGETRGAEAFDILQAINTGHHGSMTTIHANSPREAMLRLEQLVHMGQETLSPLSIRQQIMTAVDMVIQVQRGDDGSRRVTHVTDIVGMEGDMLVLQDLCVAKNVPQKGVEYVWANTTSRNPKIQRVTRKLKS